MDNFSISPPTEELYFIIGGGGQVGFFLARDLFIAGHEVVLLEKDPRRVRALEDELGEVVIRGDACEVRTLQNIGCDRADYMIAVTGDDEDNLVMCQVARVLATKSSNFRTIARVNNTANLALFKKLGISTTISLTNSILTAIESQIPSIESTQIQLPTNIEVISYVIAERSPSVGKTLDALSLPATCRVIMLRRGEQDLWKYQRVSLMPGDVVVVATPPENRAMLGDTLVAEQVNA